jgi:hypothetical protein
MQHHVEHAQAGPLGDAGGEARFLSVAIVPLYPAVSPSITPGTPSAATP